MIEVGKKYNERTLYWMRKYYDVFSNEKLNPLGSKLSWSHYREIFPSLTDEVSKVYEEYKNKLMANNHIK